jgi:hypothetical protein
MRRSIREGNPSPVPLLHEETPTRRKHESKNKRTKPIAKRRKRKGVQGMFCFEFSSEVPRWESHEKPTVGNAAGLGTSDGVLFYGIFSFSFKAIDRTRKP